MIVTVEPIPSLSFIRKEPTSNDPGAIAPSPAATLAATLVLAALDDELFTVEGDEVPDFGVVNPEGKLEDGTVLEPVDAELPLIFPTVGTLGRIGIAL